MSPADVIRKRELGLIHMAKAHFKKTAGMTDDDYRAVVLQVTSKTSSADLDAAGRDKLLRHFKDKGFVVIRTKAAVRNDFIREPQVKKLLAMWYALADVNAVAKPESHMACSRAVEAWAKQQLAGTVLGPLDALRFATGAQLDKLIESMKQWGQRVNARTY
jgi:hypothetical protein